MGSNPTGTDRAQRVSSAVARLATTLAYPADENIGAASVELTSDELREIDGAAATITLQGARYPEKLERMTGR